MYGWRARIGFICPSSTLDTPSVEFYRMAPEGVSLVVTILGISRLEPGDIEAALENLDRCALTLAENKADIVVLGGSPPIVHKGAGYEREVADRLHRITGLPATTSQEAAVEALRSLGAETIAVASPFPEDQNAKLKKYLEHNGFRVAAITGLSLPIPEMALLPLSASFRAGKEAFLVAQGAQALYMPCAAWPTCENIAVLEQDLQAPVVTSLQAMIWWSLRTLKVEVAVEGYGRLLRGDRPDMADGGW